ncbi:MAG: GAP family protein, partial [Caldilinea sp.]|nr:GAP family protein [Caldilinea sp.]
PRWLELLDDIPPYLVVGVGLTGVLFNAKNLPLFLAAVRRILAADLPLIDSFIALAIFIALASVTVVTPIVLFLAGGERMHARLERMRAWLTRYNEAILGVVFMIMGAVLVLDNAAALAGF